MFAFGKEGLGNNAKHLIPTVEAFGGFLIAQVNKGDSYSFLARKGQCHNSRFSLLFYCATHISPHRIALLLNKMSTLS